MRPKTRQTHNRPKHDLVLKVLHFFRVQKRALRWPKIINNNLSRTPLTTIGPHRVTPVRFTKSALQQWLLSRQNWFSWLKLVIRRDWSTSVSGFVWLNTLVFDPSLSTSAVPVQRFQNYRTVAVFQTIK